MRGNHIVWGRVQEPIPDRTTAQDRARILECELREPREQFASRYVREVWLRGSCIGLVKVSGGSQWRRHQGGDGWLYSGSEWGEGDPQYALAIIDLLSDGGDTTA